VEPALFPVEELGHELVERVWALPRQPVAISWKDMALDAVGIPHHLVDFEWAEAVVTAQLPASPGKVTSSVVM
jgi:hypothetical protein